MDTSLEQEGQGGAYDRVAPTSVLACASCILVMPETILRSAPLRSAPLRLAMISLALLRDGFNTHS